MCQVAGQGEVVGVLVGTIPFKGWGISPYYTYVRKTKYVTCRWCKKKKT